MTICKFVDRVTDCRSEGGCLPGEWGESSYKLAIRAATLVRVYYLLFILTIVWLNLIYTFVKSINN